MNKRVQKEMAIQNSTSNIMLFYLFMSVFQSQTTLLLMYLTLPYYTYNNIVLTIILVNFFLLGTISSPCFPST
jgi:hypothetical protein